MCGIFGILKGVKKEDQKKHAPALTKFFGEACIVGSLRGTDSTGLFQIDYENNIYTQKAPISGVYFAQMKDASSYIVDAGDSRVTIGHHRLATHGSVCYDNAHPFTIYRDDGNYLVGVHNGVMGKYKTKEDDRTFEVDSEWALYRITRDGLDAFKDFDSSASFVFAYFDSFYNKFYLAANGARSIAFGFVKNADIMVMASERGMLEWLAERNNLDLEGVQVIKANVLLEFPKQDLRSFTSTSIEKPKPVIVPPVRDTRTGQFTPRKPRVGVTHDEHQLALNRKLYGKSCTFILRGVSQNTGGLVGMASDVQGGKGEVPAIIRGIQLNARVLRKWSKAKKIVCTVIGADLAEGELCYILSSPSKFDKGDDDKDTQEPFDPLADDIALGVLTFDGESPNSGAGPSSVH